MIRDKKNVGMAEHAICKSPSTLTVVGLGSCVAVALYHKKSETGGLVHIMLPQGRLKDGVKPGRYANVGIALLHESLEKQVGSSGVIVAKIAGGSQMFKLSSNFSVGEKNVIAVKKELKKLGIQIIGEDTGKNYGRSIFFTPHDGQVRIKSVYGENII